MEGAGQRRRRSFPRVTTWMWAVKFTVKMMVSGGAESRGNRVSARQRYATRADKPTAYTPITVTWDSHGG